MPRHFDPYKGSVSTAKLCILHEQTKGDAKSRLNNRTWKQSRNVGCTDGRYRVPFADFAFCLSCAVFSDVRAVFFSLILLSFYASRQYPGYLEARISIC